MWLCMAWCLQAGNLIAHAEPNQTASQPSIQTCPWSEQAEGFACQLLLLSAFSVQQPLLRPTSPDHGLSHKHAVLQVSLQQRLADAAAEADHALEALHMSGMPVPAFLGCGSLPSVLPVWQRHLASHATADDCELLLCLRHIAQVSTDAGSSRSFRALGTLMMLWSRVWWRGRLLQVCILQPARGA